MTISVVLVSHGIIWSFCKKPLRTVMKSGWSLSMQGLKIYIFICIVCNAVETPIGLIAHTSSGNMIADQSYCHITFCLAYIVALLGFCSILISTLMAYASIGCISSATFLKGSDKSTWHEFRVCQFTNTMWRHTNAAFQTHRRLHYWSNSLLCSL